MKHIITFVVLAALVGLVSHADSKSINSLQMNDYVRFNGVHGFLRYAGLHSGIEVYALSEDFGSAVPSQDFRLYIKQGDAYRNIISLPMLLRKGYRCVVQKDRMSVYVTQTLAEARRSVHEESPLIVIDLKKIIEANSDVELLKN